MHGSAKADQSSDGQLTITRQTATRWLDRAAQMPAAPREVRDLSVAASAKTRKTGINALGQPTSLCFCIARLHRILALYDPTRRGPCVGVHCGAENKMLSIEPSRGNKEKKIGEVQRRMISLLWACDALTGLLPRHQRRGAVKWRCRLD
jgi:hypothetical protein